MTTATKTVAVSAVCLPGRPTVHAGYLVNLRDGGDGASYAPSCSAGKPRYDTTTSRLVPAMGAPVTDRVTCGHCRHLRAEVVAQIHAQQDAARPKPAIPQAHPAGAQTAALYQAVADLAAHMVHGDFPTAGMTCTEADALAAVMLAGGHPQAAVNAIAAHVDGDTDDEDEHHVAGYDGWAAAEAFARRHVWELAEMLGLCDVASELRPDA